MVMTTLSHSHNNSHHHNRAFSDQHFRQFPWNACNGNDLLHITLASDTIGNAAKAFYLQPIVKHGYVDITVECRYNTNTNNKDSPWPTCEGEIYDTFCEFSVWIVIVLLPQGLKYSL